MNPRVLTIVLWIAASGCREVAVDEFPASESGNCPEGFTSVGDRCYRRPAGAPPDSSTPMAPPRDGSVRTADGQPPDGAPHLPAVPDGGTAVPSNDASPSCPSGRCLRAQRLVASASSTFALQADRTVKSWGRNDWGVLGYPTSGGGSSGTPKMVPGLQNVRELDAASGVCAVLTDSNVQCWGRKLDGDFQIGAQVDAPGVVIGSMGVSVSVGLYHACSRTPIGGVQCWGDNREGQLGNGTNTLSEKPVSVVDLTAATDIAAWGNTTCAVISDGSVWCWGSNLSGGLGRAGVVNSNAPLKIPGISNARLIASGSIHACVLLMDGSIRCWGDDGFGQLGNVAVSAEPFSAPVAVSGLPPATAVSAGGAHTCALIQGGTVRCWGKNLNGQLGNGTRYNALMPVAVVGVTDAVYISAGGAHTCAILADASVVCWGANSDGQIGGVGADVLTPIRVLE